MNIRIIVYYWFFRLRQTSCRKGQNRRKYCLPPLPPAPATVPRVARLVLPAIQLWAQLQWSPAPAPPAWLYTTLLGNINEHNIVNQTCRLLTSSQPALMWCAVQKMATENLQLARRLVRPHPCLSTEESHPDSVACASHARYRSCSSSSTLLSNQRRLYSSCRFHIICLPCFLANVLHMRDIVVYSQQCPQNLFLYHLHPLLWRVFTVTTELLKYDRYNDAKISSDSSKNLPSSCVLNKEYFIGTAPCSELLD